MGVTSPNNNTTNKAENDILTDYKDNKTIFKYILKELEI